MLAFTDLIKLCPIIFTSSPPCTFSSLYFLLLFSFHANVLILSLCVAKVNVNWFENLSINLQLSLMRLILEG